MGVHIQNGAIDPQTIKPITSVTALVLSAGVNDTVTPIMKILNELSGPANILQVFANGVVVVGGILPRVVTGTSTTDPSSGDGVPDGATMVQTTTNMVWFKSNSTYLKINSEECNTFSTYLSSVTASSTSVVCDFTVPTGRTLVVKSIGSLLYNSNISVSVYNVTDSTSVSSTSSPTHVVNTALAAGKEVQFQVTNADSGSAHAASVIIKYEFI